MTIPPEMGRAGVQIAVFLIATSLGVLLFVEPGTAEFVVTVTTLMIAILFLIVLVILVRRSAR